MVHDRPECGTKRIREQVGDTHMGLLRRVRHSEAETVHAFCQRVRRDGDIDRGGRHTHRKTGGYKHDVTARGHW